MKKIQLIVACLSLISIGTQLLAGELSSVEPPKTPRLSEESDEDAAARMQKLVQPPALRDELMALTTGSIEKRTEKLKKKVLADLVYVKGGSFMMGDFGPTWSPEKFYYTPGVDNKPLHKVTLTGYSLARYKTTYAEFDIFADATGQPRGGMELDKGLYRNPLVPVGVYWQRAKDYCTWLAKETGVPFDLPTEAQWEYAARSRGQNFIWATDNGNMEIGRNVPTLDQQDHLSPIVRTAPDDANNVTRTALYPVGIFPPNPLGLYDMNADGWEWMADWYDPAWYKSSPELNPKGPSTGTKRSVRAYSDGDYIAGLNMVRFADDPMLVGKDLLTGKIGPGVDSTHSVRCAVMLDHAVSATK